MTILEQVRHLNEHAQVYLCPECCAAIDEILKPDFHIRFKQELRHMKKYAYLVTFTLKNPADAEAAEKYIRRIPTRTPLAIEEMWYVRELTKSGVPHFHCAIKTTRVLKSDRFVTYTKRFGFAQVKSQKVGTNLSEMINYMSKESDPECLFTASA